MAKAKDFATETEGDVLAEQDRGSVHVLLGRGRTGKTTWARWAVERARADGREVAVADGDRNNSTLSSFYPSEVSRPAAADNATMTKWLEGLMESAIETRKPLLLDMGGGDRSFAMVSERYDFTQVLPENGVDLTAWYFVAGGRDDGETLVLMEQGGFRPSRRVLVLNEGLASSSHEGEDPYLAMRRAVEQGDDPFAEILREPDVRRCLDGGVKLLRMPPAPLASMKAADNLFIAIQDAAKGRVPNGEDGLPHPDVRPLNLWRRSDLNKWLGRMEEQHNGAGVLEWLP